MPNESLPRAACLATYEPDQLLLAKAVRSESNDQKVTVRFFSFSTVSVLYNLFIVAKQTPLPFPSLNILLQINTTAVNFHLKEREREKINTTAVLPAGSYVDCCNSIKFVLMI